MLCTIPRRWWRNDEGMMQCNDDDNENDTMMNHAYSVDVHQLCPQSQWRLKGLKLSHSLQVLKVVCTNTITLDDTAWVDTSTHAKTKTQVTTSML